jgi:hypothetical protein
MEVTCLAAAEHQHPHGQFSGGFEIARIGDNLRRRTQPRRGRQIGVRRHQHRHRAQPRQRGYRHQRAGSSLHQHTDVGALAHADLDQAADDIVDATIHCLVGVDTAVEQQAFAFWRAAGLLGHDPAERDAGVIVDLSEPGQPGQRAHGLDGQRAGRLVGRGDGVGRGPGHAERHFRRRGGPVGHAGGERDAAFGVFGGPQRHRGDVLGHVTVTIEPLHPLGDGRPGLGGRLRADDQAEMACTDEEFVDVGLRGGPLDPAHRGRLADVIDLTDHRQDGAVDVAECDQVAVDGEPAGHHPVVGDELLEQLGDRRSGPCDPAFRREESPLLFA